jgi:molybdate transport system permease protein
MPLLVYTELQRDPDAAVVVSVILLAVSIAVLALLRERWFNQVVR